MSEMWDMEAKISENKLAALSQESRMWKDVFTLFTNFEKHVLFYWEDSEAGISGTIRLLKV